MKLNRRSKKWTIVVLIVLVISAAKIVFFPPGSKLTENRMLDAAFDEWMLENHTNAYPNIEGNDGKSLSLVLPLIAANLKILEDIKSELRDYVYLPGLHPDDPSDLVLLYVKVKSRKRWDDDFPTIFREQKWIVISPGFSLGNTGGVLNDWIDTPQFKARLEKTIEFLKENKRPYWQNVVEEQTKFLNSIRD
jgi:hypothetical protein